MAIETQGQRAAGSLQLAANLKERKVGDFKNSWQGAQASRQVAAGSALTTGSSWQQAAGGEQLAGGREQLEANW